MNALEWTAWEWTFVGILLIVFAYVLVRTVSFAYFRTKAEYLRSVVRELRKEDKNG